MPERPDLEYVVPRLHAALNGATLTGLRVKKPIVLRVAVEGDPAALLAGRSIAGVARRAHFVLFALSGAPPLEMVIAPMLAGRFTILARGEKSPADLAVAFALEDGRELRYLDDVQMGKVYLIARGDWARVPGLAKIGLDVLGPAFTRDAFRAIAKKRRDQAKVFLMDKSALDAMGNAYADEVLWAARVHPKAWVSKLDEATMDRLHDAIVEVLERARAEIERRQPPLHEKLRDFLKVRGKPGEPCPRCGDKLRRAGVHGHDAIFCPTCQPDARKSSVVDWKKISGP